MKSHILTVTQLTSQIKNLLEGTFPDVWVEGEVSSWKRAASGHYYFSLKDDRAQVRCVRRALAQVSRLLRGKGHAMILDDLVHPFAFYLEDLDGGIHQFSQVLEEQLVVSASEIGSAGTVEGYHLPGAHGEVLAVLEVQLILKLVVALRGSGKLICTALIA